MSEAVSYWVQQGNHVAHTHRERTEKCERNKNKKNANAGMAEEQRIAEEFRRYLQSKYRHEILKPKLPPQEILSQRLKRAEQQLQSSGSPPEAVAKTMHELQTRLKQVELVTEDDEPFSRSIVEGLCRDIEKVCLQQNIPLHGGVARGIVESLSIDATLHPAPFSEAGVLSLSRGFIALCSHLSKLN